MNRKIITIVLLTLTIFQFHSCGAQSGFRVSPKEMGGYQGHYGNNANQFYNYHYKEELIDPINNIWYITIGYSPYIEDMATIEKYATMRIVEIAKNNDYDKYEIENMISGVHKSLFINMPYVSYRVRFLK